MIVEIVVFDLPAGTDKPAALALYRQSAEKWLTNPDLMEKYYFFNEEQGQGGGVYIWPSREAAKRWHGEEYRRMIAALYGSAPRIHVFDALLRLEPGVGAITEP